MGWVRFEDSYYTHPKLYPLGYEALGMDVAGTCWCNANRTDGFIPRSVLVHLGSCSRSKRVRIVSDLVRSGKWTEVDGGYQIHDYLQYQPSKEVLDEQDKRRSEIGKMGADARWHSDKSAMPQGNAPTPPNPPQPPEGSKDPSVRSKRGKCLPPDFAVTEEMRFWARTHVPRIDVDWETDKFIDWAIEKGITSIDWRRRWQNWMRKAQDQLAPDPSKTVYA